MEKNYWTLPHSAFRIRWWERLVLRFLPTYVAFDEGAAVFYKMWRGVVYCVGSEVYSPVRVPNDPAMRHYPPPPPRTPSR
jgi:hypothetical protein